MITAQEHEGMAVVDIILHQLQLINAHIVEFEDCTWKCGQM